MNKSKIEWTDFTWNPVTGCTKLSEGCKNCYAERIAKRFWDHPFSEVKLHPERLSDVDGIKQPQKIFVCSMSDLFHENVPMDFIGDVFDEMIGHPKHTFVVLTKRPYRMSDFVGWYGLVPIDYKNVWLGISAENSDCLHRRMKELTNFGAIVRFVSVEPMLEDIYIPHYWLKKINWIICGSESGPGARHFEMNWARSLKNQCVEADIPFFFKQATINGKLVKMPELDGQIWDQMPEVK